MTISINSIKEYVNRACYNLEVLDTLKMLTVNPEILDVYLEYPKGHIYEVKFIDNRSWRPFADRNYDKLPGVKPGWLSEEEYCDATSLTEIFDEDVGRSIGHIIQYDPEAYQDIYVALAHYIYTDNYSKVKGSQCVEQRILELEKRLIDDAKEYALSLKGNKAHE